MTFQFKILTATRARRTCTQIQSPSGEGRAGRAALTLLEVECAKDLSVSTSLSHQQREEKEITKVPHQQLADSTRSMLAAVLFVREVSVIRVAMVTTDVRQSELREDRTAMVRMRSSIQDLSSQRRCPSDLAMTSEISTPHETLTTMTELGGLLQLIVVLQVEALVSYLELVTTLGMHEKKLLLR